MKTALINQAGFREIDDPEDSIVFYYRGPISIGRGDEPDGWGSRLDDFDHVILNLNSGLYDDCVILDWREYQSGPKALRLFDLMLGAGYLIAHWTPQLRETLKPGQSQD